MGIVLGLHGRSQAGKDTTADYLIDNYGWAAKFSFARNLKDMCKRIFVLSEHEVATQEGKKLEFATPLKFTENHLGSVLFWMSLTHADRPISPQAKLKVKSLVGTLLVSPRHVLQFVGTEVCRMLVPTYHADVLVAKVVEAKEDKVIVTDVRFPDEGEAVLGISGGILVNVLRPGVSLEGSIAQHSSETAMGDWEKFDDTLNNDTEGLTFFYSRIQEFLERNEL